MGEIRLHGQLELKEDLEDALGTSRLKRRYVGRSTRTSSQTIWVRTAERRPVQPLSDAYEFQEAYMCTD